MYDRVAVRGVWYIAAHVCPMSRYAETRRARVAKLTRFKDAEIVADSGEDGEKDQAAGGQYVRLVSDYQKTNLTVDS